MNITLFVIAGAMSLVALLSMVLALRISLRDSDHLERIEDLECRLKEEKLMVEKVCADRREMGEAYLQLIEHNRKLILERDLATNELEHARATLRNALEEWDKWKDPVDRTLVENMTFGKVLSNRSEAIVKCIEAMRGVVERDAAQHV